MNASLPVDLWAHKQRGEAERGAAAPASPLIYQNRNNGIENCSLSLRDEFAAAKEREAVKEIMGKLPPRLRKKAFALQLRIEWMIKTYGLEHVGMQTLTVRENVTDPKEFERRFKSIATNAFPKVYQDWVRIFERQQRGAWHVHVVVATKEDIRTGTDVVTLDRLIKDHNHRLISRAVYYAGLKRLASPNLKAIWKEFRRLCGLKEFQSRRHTKGARYYKFDACHLLPVIKSGEALAKYVSDYISKGFVNRRPEDKGVRLVGCSRNVSRICNERFSWVEGGGKLHRCKVGILAGLLHFKSLDDFAANYGPKWAYHLGPVLPLIVLPYYDDLKQAKMDGWGFETEPGTSLPLLGWTPPAETIRQSHWQAFMLAKEILLQRTHRRPGSDEPKRNRLIGRQETPVEPAFKPRPVFKSWMDYTAGDD